jgi:dTDP-4-dehydrorhamnose reductase
MKTTRKTLLIVGVSSFVGSNLAEYFKRNYRVIGTYFEHPVFISQVLTFRCSIYEKETVQYIIYNFRPDFIIYCGGLTSVHDCSVDDKKCEALNTNAVFSLASAAERIKAKFCLISSSYVFSGLGEKSFSENDTPDPRTMLGKSQTSAEFFVQKSSLNYIIFRCSRLYGRTINYQQKNWFEFLEHDIFFRKNIVCDSQVKHGFIDIMYLALIMKMCFEKDVINRLFNVSSADILSYYEFSKLYAEIFSADATLLQKGNWPFPGLKNESSYEYSGQMKEFRLKTQNIEDSLGIQLPTIRESLEFTLKRMSQFKNVKSKVPVTKSQYI